MKWFQKLFSRKVMVYTAFSNEDYLHVAARLNAAGVRYTIKSQGSNAYLGTQWSNQGAPVQYNFYVKPDEEDKAQRVIHHHG